MSDADHTTRYLATRNGLLHGFDTSGWLKMAICALERRDPVDALRDADLLVELQRIRVEQALRLAHQAAPSAPADSSGGKS